MIKGRAIRGSNLTSGQSAGLEQGYQDLIIAIIKQAVRDYETVLIRLFSRPAGAKKAALEMKKTELEVFFHSEWFGTLTDFDGDILIAAARKHAVEKAKEAIRRKHKKKLKDMEKAGKV